MSKPKINNLINVTDVVESNICVSSESGDKLYFVISSILREGVSVTLSFRGIDDLTLTPAFLSSAIGLLYNGEFTDEEVDNNLDFINISIADMTLVESTIDRAKRFFKDPSVFELALDNLLFNS